VADGAAQGASRFGREARTIKTFIHLDSLHTAIDSPPFTQKHALQTTGETGKRCPTKRAATSIGLVSGYSGEVGMLSQRQLNTLAADYIFVAHRSCRIRLDGAVVTLRTSMMGVHGMTSTNHQLHFRRIPGQDVIVQGVSNCHWPNDGHPVAGKRTAGGR